MDQRPLDVYKRQVKDRLPVSPEAAKVWLATAPGTGTPLASSLTVTVAGMGVPDATATVE